MYQYLNKYNSFKYQNKKQENININIIFKNINIQKKRKEVFYKEIYTIDLFNKTKNVYLKIDSKILKIEKKKLKFF